jgi:hypothetical protein
MHSSILGWSRRIDRRYRAAEVRVQRWARVTESRGQEPARHVPQRTVPKVRPPSMQTLP